MPLLVALALENRKAKTCQPFSVTFNPVRDTSGNYNSLRMRCMRVRAAFDWAHPEDSSIYDAHKMLMRDYEMRCATSTVRLSSECPRFAMCNGPMHEAPTADSGSGTHSQPTAS